MGSVLQKKGELDTQTKEQFFPNVLVDQKPDLPKEAVFKKSRQIGLMKYQKRYFIKNFIIPSK